MLSIKMNVMVNKDRKLEIQLPEEIKEGEHELVLVIGNSVDKPKKSLKDFVGTVNWPIDGMALQNQIRSEWK